MSEKEGHAAFPRSIVHVLTDGQVMGYEAEGMSLRDYFAAAALQGLTANPGAHKTGGGTLTADDMASGSYELADAMLRARRPA